VLILRKYARDKHHPRSSARRRFYVLVASAPPKVCTQAVQILFCERRINASNLSKQGICLAEHPRWNASIGAATRPSAFAAYNLSSTICQDMLVSV